MTDPGETRHLVVEEGEDSCESYVRDTAQDFLLEAQRTFTGIRTIPMGPGAWMLLREPDAPAS